MIPGVKCATIWGCYIGINGENLVDLTLPYCTLLNCPGMAQEYIIHWYMYIAMYLTLGRKVNFGMHLNFYFFWIYNRKRKEELYHELLITLISSQFQMSQVQDL